MTDEIEQDVEKVDHWLPPYFWPAFAVCIFLFALVALGSYFGHWHWLSNLWFNYAWSSDKGNGPEALQQTLIYAAIAVVFVPVVRKFIAREFAKVHHSIHMHGTEITAHLHHIAKESGLKKFDHTDAYKQHIANHKAPE